MGFFHTWQELFSLLRAHPSTLHDKAQVPVGKVYQYVQPCAFKFVHHIKNPAIKDDVLIFYATFAMLHRIVLYSFHHKVSENSKDSKTLSNLLSPRNLQNILTIKYVFSCGIKENGY